MESIQSHMIWHWHISNSWWVALYAARGQDAKRLDEESNADINPHGDEQLKMLSDLFFFSFPET